jgi:hypothetical protein
MGKNGASLEERYKPYPETYLSMAVDGFPNYFMMLGPNAGVGSGSLTMILEMEGDYITKLYSKASEGRLCGDDTKTGTGQGLQSVH